MPGRSLFKHHLFPLDIIICAVRCYLRYPLSFQDVVDLLAESDVTVDRSTVYCWVQKFGPELTKRTEKHLRRASFDWHVDETYIRVGGKWRYFGRAIDANGPPFGTLRRKALSGSGWSTSASPRDEMLSLLRPFSTRPSSVCACTGSYDRDG